MVMLAADPSITTVEQLLALPEDDLRHELLRGLHVVTPGPRRVHQLVHWELQRLISGFIVGKGHLCGFSAPCDVRLGPDTVVQPDICVVRIDPAAPPRDWTDDGVPELVVEILSPATARRDRGLKRRIYQEAGVGEYWIVDLDAELVERWRPGVGSPEILDDTIGWQPDADGEVLTIPLRDVFRRVRGPERPRA